MPAEARCRPIRHRFRGMIASLRQCCRRPYSASFRFNERMRAGSCVSSSTVDKRINVETEADADYERLIIISFVHKDCFGLAKAGLRRDLHTLTLVYSCLYAAVVCMWTTWTSFIEGRHHI